MLCLYWQRRRASRAILSSRELTVTFWMLENNLPHLLLLRLCRSLPHPSIPLHLSQTPFSCSSSFAPRKCSLATFKNSTSHSDFTRLLSCLRHLSASVCLSPPSSLSPSVRPSVLQAFLYLTASHISPSVAILSLYTCHLSLLLSCLSARPPRLLPPPLIVFLLFLVSQLPS